MDKIRFLPELKTEGKPTKVKDIKAAILNDVAMLDDPDFQLVAHVRLTRMNKAIADVLKDSQYRDTVIEAQALVSGLQKQPKVTVEGAEIASGATYTTYNFSSCHHPLLNFILDVEAKFKELRKEIEKELKDIPALKQDIVGTDFDTGEVKTAETGGKKKIILEEDDIKNRVGFVINKAEILLQDIEDNNSIFTVYPPEKIQTMGIKVTKG